MTTCSYIAFVKEAKTKKRTLYTQGEAKPAVLRESAAGVLSPLVTVRDAKTHFSALLEWVSGGREITITSDGKPKARLVPAPVELERRVFRGMGRFLTEQPIHGGPSAEELIREDRDARGW